MWKRVWVKRIWLIMKKFTSLLVIKMITYSLQHNVKVKKVFLLSTNLFTFNSKQIWIPKNRKIYSSSGILSQLSHYVKWTLLHTLKLNLQNESSNLISRMNTPKLEWNHHDFFVMYDVINRVVMITLIHLSYLLSNSVHITNSFYTVPLLSSAWLHTDFYMKANCNFIKLFLQSTVV